MPDRAIDRADHRERAADGLRERLDAALRECVERDRTGVLPRFWRQRLAKIDLHRSCARRELAALERAVCRYRAQYPFGFPSIRWGEARLLSLRLEGVSALLAELRGASSGSRMRLPARVWRRIRASRRPPQGAGAAAGADYRGRNGSVREIVSSRPGPTEMSSTGTFTSASTRST